MYQKRRNKVLVISDHLGLGGAERQLALLVKYLPIEWDCRVWSLDDGPFAEEIRNLGIQVGICSRRWQWDISPIGNLFNIVRVWHPDVIHSWGWIANLAVYPIAKIFRIPLVNGIVRTGKPIYYRSAFTRISSHLGDVVVSNSEAGLRNWGIKLSKGVVIYNGFDWHRILDNGKFDNKQINNKFIVVMAARMARAKDFTLFISALRKLVNAGETNWKFLAIGQGEHREMLLKENYELVQQGFLEFPDAGLDVIPFLKISSVGVLLTKSKYHEEGCSNTIMEYMACGLPVIATDSGGNKELIEDNVTGFIIPDGDLDTLLKKLLWIFNNPSEAKQFGEKGRERLNKQFSSEKMVESTIKVYKSLIEKR